MLAKCSLLQMSSCANISLSRVPVALENSAYCLEVVESTVFTSFSPHRPRTNKQMALACSPQNLQVPAPPARSRSALWSPSHIKDGTVTAQRSVHFPQLKPSLDLFYQWKKSHGELKGLSLPSSIQTVLQRLRV